MTVYGEEHLSIDISKGLFLSPTPDYIPEGYLADCKNMIQNGKGGWELRKAFTNLGTFTPSNFAAGPTHSTFRPVPVIRWPSVFISTAMNGGVSTSFATTTMPQLAVHYPTTANQDVIAHVAGRRQTSDTTYFKSQIASGRGTNFAQYKDKVYAARTNGTGGCDIYEFTAWTQVAAVSNVTSTALGVTLSTADYYDFGYEEPCIVTYQNRMFASVGSRIHYTDIPTAGGFPTTWNTSNFFELSGGTGGMGWVRNMIVYNNLLYIFTTCGIYVLNGRGATSNWSFEFITDTIKTYHKQHVALVGGVFIATDNKKLYAFNGNTVQEMGTEIRYLFDVYNSFNIVPFLDGFILGAAFFKDNGSTQWDYSNPTGADTTIWPKVRNMYYDGNVWTEFTEESNTIHILDGATQKTLYPGAETNISLFVYYSITNDNFGISYYDKNTIGTPVGRLRTKDIVLKNDGYTRVKKGTVKVFSLIDDFTVNVRRNGSSTVVKTRTPVPTVQGDQNLTSEFTGAEINTRFNIEVTATGQTPMNTDFPDYVPCFELKSIAVTVESDGRDQVGADVP